MFFLIPFFDIKKYSFYQEHINVGKYSMNSSPNRVSKKFISVVFADFWYCYSFYLNFSTLCGNCDAFSPVPSSFCSHFTGVFRFSGRPDQEFFKSKPSASQGTFPLKILIILNFNAIKCMCLFVCLLF